jgi:hypothetical protein
VAQVAGRRAMPRGPRSLWTRVGWDVLGLALAGPLRHPLLAKQQSDTRGGGRSCPGVKAPTLQLGAVLALGLDGLHGGRQLAAGGVQVGGALLGRVLQVGYLGGRGEEGGGGESQRVGEGARGSWPARPARICWQPRQRLWAGTRDPSAPLQWGGSPGATRAPNTR